MRKLKQRSAKPPVVSWRPKAPTQAQKTARAMQTHHRARRIGPKCAAEGCNKLSVEGSEYCPLHRNLRGAITVQTDLNVYGA